MNFGLPNQVLERTGLSLWVVPRSFWFAHISSPVAQLTLGAMRIVSMFVGLVLVLAPGCTTLSFRMRTPEDLLVSFPDRLKPGEQIVGFEVYVTNGKIVALNKAPEDWLVNIVAAWWDSTITGTPGHGASAFQDMTPLKRFLTLHKDRAEFNVSGSLVVTTNFTTMTTNHFARSDFIFE